MQAINWGPIACKQAPTISEYAQTSMDPFSLAVVIPTFNRRPLLERCLDSVHAQTRCPEEIIVVDDGSTDGTADWIQTLFPSIKLIAQENRGVSAARNAGIQAASCEWIAFLDSDDVWLPNKIEAQISALKSNPEYKICHSEERWIFQGKQKRVPPAYRKQEGWIFENCLPLCAISPSTAVIHRSIFETVGLFDESLPACEDYDLWLRIACRYPVLLVDQPLIEKHGGNPDQLSNQRGLDSYRIHALQSILNSGHLNSEYRKSAIETLRSKCDIVANAAEKSGRTKEAERFRNIRDQLR